MEDGVYPSQQPLTDLDNLFDFPSPTFHSVSLCSQFDFPLSSLPRASDISPSRVLEEEEEEEEEEEDRI
ncbi:hypothetical protein E2C01_047419 [Portunus trituberculatus]|uniref:Uncharacterized protein n=1 Tax=Portunus trituberculatus TaxID=210409 RepID=A0A5B7GAF6_PORTR|nr:hypothetical protein [Portunus trituberculatus]